MTEGQKARVVAAIAETTRALERFNRRAPECRDTKLIADYEAHLVRLGKMLETGTIPAPSFCGEG